MDNEDQSSDDGTVPAPASIFLVCGGRSFTDRDAVFRALDALHRKYLNLTILTGACPTGADALAEEWAKDREVPYIGVPAQWARCGASAGPRRNAVMLGYLPAGVVAFRGGDGTADMCRRAEAVGVSVWRVG